MAADPLTSPSRTPISTSALRALARVAGEGEVRAQAVQHLEESRAGLELSGWLLLQELWVDGAQIRHAVIGPGGVVVAVPCGPDPDFKDLAEVERQADALAQLLRLERQDVLAAVVMMNSSAAPAAHFYPGLSCVIVGDGQLHDWLSDLPVVMEPAALATLRDCIYASAARAAEARPPRLPSEPRWG